MHIYRLRINFEEVDTSTSVDVVYSHLLEYISGVLRRPEDD